MERTEMFREIQSYLGSIGGEGLATSGDLQRQRYLLYVLGSR